MATVSSGEICTSDTSCLPVLPKKRLKKKATKKKTSSLTSSAQPKRFPRKSLIRKRPVSFGNPALGTYHGCLYTLDIIGEDYSPIHAPLVEGAETVERVVAMVDVPPEQVPEGILNLARSHRPYIHHVRIVTAETNEEMSLLDNNVNSMNKSAKEGTVAPTPLSNTAEPPVLMGKGKEETKEEPLLIDDTLNQESGGFSPVEAAASTPAVSSAVENAASILALDEERQAASTLVDATENTNYQPTQNSTSMDNLVDTSNNSSEEDDNKSIPSKTYVVLIEMCSVDAAEAFVEDLHGRPFTSLDPTQKCSVYQVLALSGEDGVSLLSPFFAPSAKSTSPKGSKNSSGAAKAKSTKTPKTKAAPIIVEDYNCAVCLEHMILSETEHDVDASADSRSSILTTVCNHTFHLDCLLQWQDSPCPVCRYDHSGLNEALSQCHVCGATENNYVCLICGIVSCGGPPLRNQNTTNGVSGAGGARGLHSHSPVCGGSNSSSHRHPGDTHRIDRSSSEIDNRNALAPAETSRQLSQSHARRHYDESLHAYALDTDTQHVWDFAGQGYVHRLLQNKEDGKLVEFHDPSNTTSHERSYTPGLSEAQEGEVLHRKLEGFASQYYTLLKSQLEQQRSYYQGRLEELRRESFMRKKAQTIDLINALKQEKAQSSKRLASLKGRHRKVSEDIAFLKNMNESLEANKEPLKRKIKECQRQSIEAKERMQQSLPALEEKVTKLMLQLTGEPSAVASAGEDVECAPPQTTSDNTKVLERSNSTQSDDRKPAAKR